MSYGHEACRDHADELRHELESHKEDCHRLHEDLAEEQALNAALLETLKSIANLAALVVGEQEGDRSRIEAIAHIARAAIAKTEGSR